MLDLLNSSSYNEYPIFIQSGYFYNNLWPPHFSKPSRYNLQFSWIHSNVYHFIFPLCTPCIPWLQHNWRKHNWFEYREILSDSETFKLWILCKLSVLDIWRIEGKISFLVETLTMWTKKEKTIKLMIKNLLHLLKSPANSKNI